MIRKIKNFLLILTTSSLVLGAPAMMVSGAASALTGSNTGSGTPSCDNGQGNVAAGANLALNQTASGCNTLPGSTNDLASVAKTAVNILSLIVGIIAVIMIIYGGLRYITSGGDSGSVGNAKNTLIYAIIGLIIVALAQLIVHFVLNAAINNTTGVGAS